MENMTLSDIAAVTNGNSFGGNNIWMILIILLFLMNGGAWGNNRGDYGQYATAASQQDILFSSKFQALDNKIDRIGNGIADATFALNNTIVAEGRANQAAVGQNRFDMANYNAGILSAIREDGEKTRAMIQQDKIEALQGRINQLELQSAMCGVVRYPNDMTYNAGTSPFCNCGSCCN